MNRVHFWHLLIDFSCFLWTWVQKRKSQRARHPSGGQDQKKKKRRRIFFLTVAGCCGAEGDIERVPPLTFIPKIVICKVCCVCLGQHECSYDGSALKSVTMCTQKYNKRLLEIRWAWFNTQPDPTVYSCCLEWKYSSSFLSFFVSFLCHWLKYEAQNVQMKLIHQLSFYIFLLWLYIIWKKRIWFKLIFITFQKSLKSHILLVPPPHTPQKIQLVRCMCKSWWLRM